MMPCKDCASENAAERRRKATRRMTILILSSGRGVEATGGCGTGGGFRYGGRRIEYHGAMNFGKRTLNCAVEAVMVFLALGHAGAQPPARTGGPNSALKSPEVLPDRRVVFRIEAPK